MCEEAAGAIQGNVSWSPDTGFSINGINTKILGTANHQDFAVLGVAVPDHLQVPRIIFLRGEFAFKCVI